MQITQELIEKIVREVVTRNLAAMPFPQAEPGFQCETEPLSGVTAVKVATVRPEPFDTGKAGDKVLLKDVFTTKESPRLGCGVMEMEASTFAWTLNYDEIDIVLEGSLTIIVNGKKITANKGELVLIPKNTAIEFSAPEYARFIYVTYPANWEEQ
nr:cupin domain-containing protein [uncultured Desulfobulbus sp.]